MRVFSRATLVFVLVCAGLLSPACSRFIYSPAPVVPTKQPLPYSARLALAHVGSYMVNPGAIHAMDTNMANHVAGESDHVASARDDWEQAILRYLEARKTFTQVSTRNPSDVDLILHVNVYIDPGATFQYRHVYVVRADAAMADPRTHLTLLSYTGTGKAFGEVSRDGKEDDQEPVNQAVQMALNDLFGKMEQDGRMGRL